MFYLVKMSTGKVGSKDELFPPKAFREKWV